MFNFSCESFSVVRWEVIIKDFILDHSFHTFGKKFSKWVWRNLLKFRLKRNLLGRALFCKSSSEFYFSSWRDMVTPQMPDTWKIKRGSTTSSRRISKNTQVGLKHFLKNFGHIELTFFPFSSDCRHSYDALWRFWVSNDVFETLWLFGGRIHNALDRYCNWMVSSAFWNDQARRGFHHQHNFHRVKIELHCSNVKANLKINQFS